MDRTNWIMFIFFAHVYFLQVKSQSNTKPPTCVVSFKDCTYHFDFKEHQGLNCPTINSGPKQTAQSYISRSKRSADVDSESTEFHKMRRRLQRVEQKLSKSMSSLSSRVLRGVRRMEDALNGIVGGQTKRYAENQQNEAKCPPGFQDAFSLTSCYMLSSFNTTWFEARQFCEAFDSDLVALDHVKEHNLVTFIIKNSPEYSQSYGWWTSGTYIIKTRQWMWTANMQPFTFIKWAKDEPDEESLQCVYLSKVEDHMWHDSLCTEKFNFVCEKPKT